jgi:hypothetical protein
MKSFEFYPKINGMENLLKELHDANIFASGHVYIFYETGNPEWDPGPIEFMYFIRSEDEIVPALKLEAEYTMELEIRKYLGCAKISEGCFEFKMLCFNSAENREEEFSCYLHRIRTTEEAVREAYAGYDETSGSSL